MYLLAVDVVNKCINYVSQDKGPGSSQAILHLYEQQVNKQVIHQEDAMAFVAVGGFCRSITHSQQDPLDRDLRPGQQARKQNHMQSRKKATAVKQLVTIGV